VRTRYGYIPLPREAPRNGEDAQIAAAQPAPVPEQQSRQQQQASASVSAASLQPAPSAPAAPVADHVPLVGRTAKNDLGIPAPNRFADLSVLPPHRITLKDLVRAAEAPTLSGQSEDASTPSTVGEKPKADNGIDIAVLADRGGVLTPKGTLVIDPGVDYTHSSVNRFFFDGTEIVEAVLIGNFQAQQVDRDVTTGNLALRYGITRRLEADVGLNWLYRHDNTINTNLASSDPAANFTLMGNGLGDIDFGLHYQVNQPKGLFPYFVANLRGKSDTGTGPYDVPRDLQTGLEKEEPTGSGFWSLEPSLTMIFPSDPAVLFANVGYQFALAKDINKTIEDQITYTGISTGSPEETEDLTHVGDVDPGDSLSASVGMGIGVNDSVSISFGYQHTWVLGTTTDQVLTHSVRPLTCAGTTDYSSCIYAGGDTTTITPSKNKSTDAQLGSLLMGASININPHFGLNFNVAAGLTSDAPDVEITMRTPLSISLAK
jgi:hypothetical protein